MNKSLMHRILLTAFAAAALPAAAGAADKPAAPAAPAIAVLAEKVTARPEQSAKKYVAHVEAIEEVSLQARISGIINEIRFKEGEIVKKGQLLFEIEDTTYRAKAQAAAAQLKQVEAELEYAKHDFDRKKVLYDKKAVSELVFDEAQRALKTAEAKLAEAQASLLDAQNSLSYTRIYAPITGRISKATYTRGNYVTPSSQPLADIVQIAPIYVRFSLSERDFQKLFGNADEMRKHAQLNITLADNSEYKHPGKIALVDNKVDNTTGTLTVWSVFDNQDFRLLPGGFATLFLARKAEGLKPAVTLSALMTDNQGNYVYVLDADNRVLRRPVTTGSVLGKWQFIESGLNPGETVIIDGTHKTRPGQTVKPQFAEPAK